MLGQKNIFLHSVGVIFCLYRKIKKKKTRKTIIKLYSIKLYFCILQILAMLYKKKQGLLNSHILHLTFSLVGTIDSGKESSTIPNKKAFEDILCDLEVRMIYFNVYKLCFILNAICTKMCLPIIDAHILNVKNMYQVHFM